MDYLKVSKPLKCLELFNSLFSFHLQPNKNCFFKDLINKCKIRMNPLTSRRCKQDVMMQCQRKAGLSVRTQPMFDFDEIVKQNMSGLTGNFKKR